MAVKKTIAIIGASGDMGSAMAKVLISSNYRLLLMSRNKSKLVKLSTCLKRKAPTAELAIMDCEKEACCEADIILMAVPYPCEKEVAEKIKEVATQKVVISISNPLNDRYDHLLTAPDRSAAEELQNVLPHSKVVKAFNTIFARAFAHPLKEGKQEEAFIAADDPEALQIVSEMATVMGFKPVLYEKLSSARKLEQMGLQLIELKTEENYNYLMGWNVHCQSAITFKSVVR